MTGENRVQMSRTEPMTPHMQRDAPMRIGTGFPERGPGKHLDPRVPSLAFTSPSASVPEYDFGRLPCAAHPLIAVPPLPDCELCVVIPVHNEEASIVRTLTSLATQVDLTGEPFECNRYEVLVLANNCRDRTVALARKFGEAHPGLRLHLVDTVLPPSHAHVGAARRLVMDEGCRRLGRIGRPRGVIASTDGDTQVRPDWVAAILREIARGADAVGGRIQASREDTAGLDPGARLYYRRDLAYRTLRAAYESVLNPDPFNAWPRHHHCFGASLAVTAEAYLAAGGVPAVPCLEDVALCRSLERIGARIRHSPEVGVRTSMRCEGRVGVGLSGTLTIWSRAAASGAPWYVESPAAIEREAVDRRLIRELWSEGCNGESIIRGASQLAVDAGWFAKGWQHAATSGDLYLAVEERQRQQGTGPLALPKMEVLAATAVLRACLKAHRATLRGAARLQVQRQKEGWSAEDTEDGLAA